MKNDSLLRQQLPHGVKDLFFDEAASVAEIEKRLRDLFPGWGYNLIIPPTFEYYESYVAGSTEKGREQMYRLPDRDGRTLALRPDLTTPTARIVGTKLYDQPLPLRFFYFGNVFRYEEPQAGRQREFTQAGVELIGADTPEADAEVIALAIAAMRAIGIVDFKISLGQIAYFRALLADLDLSEQQEQQVRTAIDTRNVAVLSRLLDDLPVEPGRQRAITALPKLVGNRTILDQARELTTNALAHAALERLGRVYDLLYKEELASYIILDLGEVGEMDYYTGITFEGFASGLGFSICSGGRYDDLIGQFGRPLPAVGWALGVERALLALQAHQPARPPLAPHAVVAACEHRACRWSVEHLRKDGLRVEYDVMGRSIEELIAYAKQRGIGRVLACTGPGELRILPDPEGPSEQDKIQR